jgi:hypothetical protein
MQGPPCRGESEGTYLLDDKAEDVFKPLDLRILLPPQHLMQCCLAGYVILTGGREHQPC